MKNISVEQQGLFQRTNIESNKQFQRLSETTQVVSPRNGQEEVVKNRLTHSYETATSTLIIGANVAHLKGVPSAFINYRAVLFEVALSHDIGHAPFGHDGAECLNDYFRKLGVIDGFSDNNNNLVIIDKNNIAVSDYLIASIIKYPEKLYNFQKKRYLPILEKAIEEDKEHFAKIGVNLTNQKTTIACQIMDEADRNSYTCSDISDFLCLGNKIELRKLHKMATEKKIHYRYTEINALSNIIKSGNKASIKAYFNNLKNRFNCNYQLTDDGIKVIDKSLENYREFLSDLCFEFFIKPIREGEYHKENMDAFKSYVDDVVAGKYSPSESYTKKIKNAKNEIQKYTYMRDMIAEVTDWYIINYKNGKLHQTSFDPAIK